MKTTDSLEAGELRLLETDNKVVLPIDTRAADNTKKKNSV